MKLGNEEILCINALDQVLKVQALDCMINKGNIIFVVKEEDMGKTIGKNGSLIKKLSDNLGKKIEVFGYTKKPDRFLRNALKEIEIGAVEIKEEDAEGKKERNIYIQLNSGERRKLLNNVHKLKRIKEVMKRSYDIDNIKVK